MTHPQPPAPWRVAVTRTDDGDAASSEPEPAGVVTVPVPVLRAVPAPDREKVAAVARRLEDFDWVICASVRSVRALVDARGGRWPAHVRTAAVGPVTAAALTEAGAVHPVVGEAFNARALWETLRPLDAWPERRVLVATVAGGRRDLSDGLRSVGAALTEVEAYALQPRPAEAIREDWHRAAADAAIIGSGSSAKHLLSVLGAAALRPLKAIVVLGSTPAAVLAAADIPHNVAPAATFAGALAHLASLAKARA